MSATVIKSAAPTWAVKALEGKVERQDNGCWHFIGYINEHGYGRVTYAGIRMYAHKMSYIAYRGPVPEGTKVLHSCDNPACINPEHLFLGSQQDNVDDMFAKNRDGVTGAKNRHAKLSENDVREIKDKLKAGVTQRSLADRFNVCRQTIGSIADGSNWRHVQ